MKKISLELSQWVKDKRQDLHMHPELSLQEERTCTKIAEILESLHIKVQRIKGHTGVIGLLKGKEKGPTLAFRADMDALPIEEQTDCAYKSIYPGKMHACGHDANTAIMLATAKSLVDEGIAEKMKGNIKFVFQPAEEIGQGAAMMVDNGVLKNPKVDCMLAGHMDPELPVGTTGHFKTLGYAAADGFRIEIKGKGGHGGRPHECIDPIIAGAHLVSGLQSIVARNINPTKTAVISVGKFISGKAANVIPESALIEGTIRTFSDPVRDMTMARIKDLVSGIDKSFLTTSDLIIRTGVPSVINDPEMSHFLHDVAKKVLGLEKARYIQPITGSEDFSFFAQKIPCAIMRIGCSNQEKKIIARLHSPFFDIDEKALDVGVMIFNTAVKMYFNL